MVYCLRVIDLLIGIGRLQNCCVLHFLIWKRFYRLVQVQLHRSVFNLLLLRYLCPLLAPRRPQLVSLYLLQQLYEFCLVLDRVFFVLLDVLLRQDDGRWRLLSRYVLELGLVLYGLLVHYDIRSLWSLRALILALFIQS